MNTPVVQIKYVPYYRDCDVYINIKRSKKEPSIIYGPGVRSLNRASMFDNKEELESLIKDTIFGHRVGIKKLTIVVENES